MSTLATDNFNRANETPFSNANWSTQTGDNNLALVSNAVNNANDTGDGATNWNAISWPNDQYAQCTVSDASTYSSRDGPGIGVRMSTSATTYYRCVVTANNNQIAVDKLVTGTATNLATRTITFTSGQVLYVEVQGTTLLIKYNGSTQGASFTDSAISSGRAGLTYSAEGTGQTAVWDDWEGGDFAAAGLPPGSGECGVGTGDSSTVAAMMR